MSDESGEFEVPPSEPDASDLEDDLVLEGTSLAEALAEAEAKVAVAQEKAARAVEEARQAAEAAEGKRCDRDIRGIKRRRRKLFESGLRF